MILADLKNWALSEYNEGYEGQLDYYMNERQCDICDKAYVFYHDTDELCELEIVHIISRSDDMALYDGLPKDVLLIGEKEYNADMSAEFITDDDSYLVWFKLGSAIMH